MCLCPIYNVMIGFTASNFTLETLKIFYQQLWHTPGHRLAAEAGLMELSRALHLPSSIQSRELPSQWVMSLHTTRNSGGKMNLYFAAIYFVSGDHWGARDHVGSQQRSQPRALSSGPGSVFDWKYLCRGEMTRWHNNLWTHSLWWDSPFISLKAPVSWCPLSTVKVFWARESLSASWNVIGFMEP